MADIFESGAEALVNPVNCVGVMGRGLAAQFAQRFPEIVQPYKVACETGDLRPGTVHVVDRGAAESPRYIINTPTKIHWRNDSTLDLVQKSLLAIRDEIETRGITSVAIPALGSGLGGLDYDDVRPLIDSILAISRAHVIAIDPTGRDHTMEHQERTPAAGVTQADIDAFEMATGEEVFDLGGDTFVEVEAPIKHPTQPLFDIPAPRPDMPRGGFYRNWFSNFTPFETPLGEDGISYPTPEHYYQAGKLANVDDRSKLVAMTPGNAKRASHRMEILPNGLDRAFTDRLMEKALRHKFAPDTRAFAMLMATGRDEIVEWNNWGDKNWGRDIGTGQGENRLGVMLMQLREEYRERGIEPTIQIDPKTIAPQSTKQDRQERPPYTAAGSRSLPRGHALARLAEGIATRLERLGYVMRSGAADGADRAFEKGVKKSRNKEIYRPSYDANKALPAGYLVIGGKKEAEARAIAAAVTTDFGKLDQFGQDLHTRNAFQVLGRDLTRPSEFVLAITKAGNDERVRGTRATMAIAAANGIPVYDLAQREQRTAFLERLTEMERTAGITHDGPVLAPAHGSLRAALPLKLDGIDPAKTISVRVLNVRDLEGKVRGDEVYVGRTKAVPGELGVQAVHDLGNPFIVGKDGLRGACADMYADYLGDKLAGDRDTQERVTALAEQAAKSGRLDLACHCAPGPCHADSIAVSIAEGLAARGFDVRTNLEPARYAALVPVQGLEAKAHEQLQQRHIEPSRAEGPWRKIEGEVIGADEHEAFVHIGDGKLRRIEQSRLGDSPLHEGVYATLVQTSQGLAQIKDDRANARALSPA